MCKEMIKTTHTEINIENPISVVSQRRVFRVTGTSSSTHRYISKQIGKDRALTKEILKEVSNHPRYGYRKVCALLQIAGWDVGPKRIYRIWRKEGLKVRKKSRMHRTKGKAENGCRNFKATGMNHIWAMDFVHDSTESGSTLRFLAIIDEYTRESIAIEVGTSFSGKRVSEVLLDLFKNRGVPGNIRTDNGKEFVGKAVERCLNLAAVNHLLIEPASPWENGYSESFNSIFRDDFLNMNVFISPKEAGTLSKVWKYEYNNLRPHGSLGQVSPAIYARSLPVVPGSAALHPPQQGEISTV